ncbi:hypothetical protein CSB11_00760 [Candidatus Campbellbacteria bacterium]|nr:MAG: hypothetical protein CSB11_00760 [Candidatus Campbellbacteria bacterium]
MYLKSLEINGFKSFGQKTSLDFKTKISSIVGPNGSGKSNVAEAFRFVLAEQSIKNMRGKKGEDLIFRGKNSHLNRASVKVVFDNSDKKLNIDYSEVNLERVVFRDGQNEYYINSNKVRAKDVIELLTSANVGASGHHIISQGEADKILSINPKERKALIEEALGLKGYVLKKDESIKKLEKTKDNLEDVKTKESINAPRIRFLKKEVEKIQKNENLKNELKDLYISFFPEKHKLQQEEKELLDKIQNKENEKKELEDRIEQKQKELVVSSQNTQEGSNDNAEKISKIQLENRQLEEKKQALQKLFAKNEYTVEVEEQKKNLFEQQKQKVEENMAFYNQKADIVFEVLNKMKRKWLENLLENQNLSSEVKENLKQSFVDFENKKEDFKKENQNFAEEILEKFNITKDGTHLENYNPELIQKLKSENSEIEKQVSSLNEQQDSLEEKIRLLSKNDDSSKKALSQEIEIEILKIRNLLSQVESNINSLENSKFKIQNELEKFTKEETFAVSYFGEEFLNQIQQNQIEQNQEVNVLEKIIRIRILLENTSVINQQEILDEYNNLVEKQKFVKDQVEDLQNTKDKLEKIIIDIENQIEEKFRIGVDKINKEFSVFFQTLFSGGKAEIKLVEIPIKNTDDEKINEFELGIEIAVSLPNKKISGLSMLSGGERSLTSIALLFAISSITPPPFIILDETDAALDEANSKRYGDMIEKLAEHSQLILITHNRETMSRAGLLYGVTMNQDGISKLLSVSFEQAEKVAK